MDREPDRVSVVTTAGMSGSEDRRLRQRRYAITQLVRVLCFGLAVLLPVPLWAKLILIVGAFALPWMGVVAANGGPIVHRRKGPTNVVDRVVSDQVPIAPGRTIDQE